MFTSIIENLQFFLTNKVNFNVGSFTHLGTRSDDNLISIVMPQPNNELKKIQYDINQLIFLTQQSLLEDIH